MNKTHLLAAISLSASCLFLPLTAGSFPDNGSVVTDSLVVEERTTIPSGSSHGITIADDAILTIRNVSYEGDGGAMNIGSGSSLTVAPAETGGTGKVIFFGNSVVNSYGDYNSGRGGAIYNSGTITLSNAAFSDNSASHGGAIYNSGTTTLANVIFSGNSASDGTAYGGAINNDASGTLVLNNALFQNNRGGHGGAINNYGSVLATNATFIGNSAGKGGALNSWSGGKITLTDAIFSNNSAKNDGGAIYNAGGEITLNITKDASYTGNVAYDGTTYSGNAVAVAAAGGFLQMYSSGQTTFNISPVATLTIGRATTDANYNAAEDSISTQKGSYGTPTLIKQGGGTLVLNADNSGYMGSLELKEGTMIVNGKLNITGKSLIGKGTLAVNGFLTTTGATTLRATHDNDAFISSANSVVVRASAPGASDNMLTIDSDIYDITTNVNFTGSGELIKKGSGTLRLTGQDSSFRNADIAEGTLEVANASILFSESDDLTKHGAGTLRLTGVNNFANTYIEQGTLEIANGGVLSTGKINISGSPATLRFDNGTLRATQNGTYNDFISGGGSGSAVEIAAGGMTIDTRSFDVGTSSGVRFTGSGNLTKTGTGTFTISSDGSDNQVGGIFINEGTLAFSSASLGTTGITISDGASIRFSGDTTLRAKSDSASFLSGTTPGTAVTTLDSTLTVDTGVYNVTANARFTGTGDLRKQGTGILRLTGKSDATGYTNIERGTLEVADGGILSTSRVYMSSYSSENPATLRFDNGTLRATQSDSMNSFISGSGSYNVVEIAAGGMTIDTRSFEVGSSARFTGSGNLTKTGSGTFTISDGSDNQVGSIFVNEGTLAFSSANLGTTGITISDGANVRFSGDTTLRAKSDSASFLSGTTPGTAVATLVSTLTVDTGVYNVTANARFTGTGDLRKQGTGILRLTGKSDATGYTNIERGTLEVADGGILSTSRVYMSGNYGYENPATLRFDNGTLRATQNDSMNSFISGSGSYNVVEIAAGGMTIDTRSFEVGSSARFTGTGNLTKTGSGTFTISGQSYYTGATIIRQGTLVVGNINALSASKTYFIGTGATLDLSALGTAYDLSGSGMAFDVGMTGTGLLDTGSNELILGGDLLFNFQEGSLDPRIVVKTLKSASVLTGATTTDTLTTPLWTSTVFNSGEQTGAFDSVILTGIISGTLTQTDNGLWTGIFDGYHFSFDGYNLSVNVSSVPEPATWGVIISLCCLGVTIWRRRK